LIIYIDIFLYYLSRRLNVRLNVYKTKSALQRFNVLSC